MTETRPETSNHRFYVDQHLFVDLCYQVVLLDSKILNLTRMEYLLLVLLMQYGGEVVPRPILMIVTRAVDMHIRKLQKKLRARQYIERVVGIGYRFRAGTLASRVELDREGGRSDRTSPVLSGPQKWRMPGAVSNREP